MRQSRILGTVGGEARQRPVLLGPRAYPFRQASHVLVDEFQDTDPLQTEIFWRLCGEPPADEDGDDWTAFALRPGALFLVGDPKQAIYRFRGADIAAYVTAREAFRAQAAEGVLSIATNFRSCAPIMEHVNARFEAPLVDRRTGSVLIGAANH